MHSSSTWPDVTAKLPAMVHADNYALIRPEVILPNIKILVGLDVVFILCMCRMGIPPSQTGVTYKLLL